MRPGETAECKPRRGDRRSRTRARERLRTSAGSDSIDRQRNRRSRAAARAWPTFTTSIGSPVAAVLAEHGALPVPYRTAADTVADLERAVDECLADDVLVFSGEHRWVSAI